MRRELAGRSRGRAFPNKEGRGTGVFTGPLAQPKPSPPVMTERPAGSRPASTLRPMGASADDEGRVAVLRPVDSDDIRTLSADWGAIGAG